eukprot:4353732-Pyramimonas_sp.AAC.2
MLVGVTNSTRFRVVTALPLNTLGPLQVGLWRADEDIQKWLPQNLYPKMQNERVLRHVATSQCEETRAAMALMQHGLWPQAQEIFFRAIQKKAGPHGANQPPQVTPRTRRDPK